MKQKIKYYFNIFLILLFFIPQQSFGFPIYAQQAYENPREANGRIVCANCHLAQKPTILETPSAILPDSVFEAIVKIPYNLQDKQILTTGQKGDLNVGAVLILPEGFKLAPKSSFSTELKLKTKGIYITPYSSAKENILVVGPISGKDHQELTFPLLSPNPIKEKNIYFAKYPIYAGGNRGRGQIYPTGEKTNNNIITAQISGKVQSIIEKEKNYEVTIVSENNIKIIQTIPNNLTLLIKIDDIITKDQNITINPNVGGFGQAESEIVLQDLKRLYSYILFSFLIIITQLLFVLKKKQYEKVQIAEQNF
jgi:apocytochrome f